MNKQYLISSDIMEINNFKIHYPNINIISNLKQHSVLNIEDGIFNYICDAELCIIGETKNYADDFINEIKDFCQQNLIKLLDYHLYMKCDKTEMKMKPINIPIIFVSSLLPNMNKNEFGKKLCLEFEQRNYKALFVSSNKMDELFGFIVFPFNMLKDSDSICKINNFFFDIIQKNKPNIVVVSIPGGMIKNPLYNANSDYGLMEYILSRALAPDYIIECVFQNSKNLNLISNLFYPYKINEYVYMNLILDGINYDFDIYDRILNIDTKKSEENVSKAINYEKIVDNIVKTLSKNAR